MGVPRNLEFTGALDKLIVMGNVPWEAWYHCMCNTYGTWIWGDSRGWRERNHRNHVVGDYRHSPIARTFEKLQATSKQLMKRDPVRLDRELRTVALNAIVECLAGDDVLVLVASLDAVHLHLLARFKDLRPRRRLGWAKYHATKRVKLYLNSHGAAVGHFPELDNGDGIWGKRSQCTPIRDRRHRLNTLNYIAKHQKSGALLWLNPALAKCS